MSSLTDRFHQPLPSWIEEIKGEVRDKISKAEFVALCHKGDITVIESLARGLWPFIDEFPRIINRGCLRLCKPQLFHKFGFVKMLSLLRHSYEALAEIESDEEQHRKLWLDIGEALGLIYPCHYNQPILPVVKAWIRGVDKPSDPFTMFLRFTSIEMIAEAVSKGLLTSDNFTSVLRKRGCHWFRVHVAHHTGMTHEELALRLAFAFHEREPVKETCNQAIQEVVDLLISAANACCNLAASRANSSPKHRRLSKEKPAGGETRSLS
jgi:pyrroloquinoline quinone (PQQ) biosynthesis protein C